jgi:hypothetical protein
MKTQLGVLLACGLFFGDTQTFCQTLPTPDIRPTLTIHLYERTDVPERILRPASELVGKTFGEVGVTVRWERGEPDSLEAVTVDRTGNTAGHRPAPDKREYLAVRLVAGTPENVLPGTIGYALPFAHQGVHATIFYDRVEQLSRSSIPMPTAATMLGAAMAHEIGHALLVSCEHSPGGLMKSSWGRTEFRFLSTRGLHFTPQEGQVIRMGALRRMQLERQSGDLMLRASLTTR